ncbi:MAG: serine/threonine-protein kinase [bacterium]
MDDLKKHRAPPVEDDEHSQATSIPVGYTPEALSEVSVVDEAEPMLGQVVGQKYRIERKIGQGGMGEVYLGLNAELGQKVAIKFLSRKLAHDEGIVARFLNEARSYCRVNHPNAVTLLEYGQHTDGTLYIITEFVEGMNLGETLKETGPFATPQVIHIGMQICEVLSAAHIQGVIHRDLKPDNVMLMPVARGRYAVKVLDFGIAKIVDDDQDGPTTETGSVFGTPEFMSPEQARGDGADARSDLYALGIILFFMVTGKLPFRGKNKLAVLNKQLNDAPPRPSVIRPDLEVSPRLEAVIMKCLNKVPGERYPAAEDLHEALEELASPVGKPTSKLSPVVDGPVSTPKLLKINTVHLGGRPTSLRRRWQRWRRHRI